MEGPLFVRGDVDSSGAVNITDAIFLLGYLFQGTAAPTCLDAADVDDLGNGAPNITDAIFLLGWLFQGTAHPPAPVPLMYSTRSPTTSTLSPRLSVNGSGSKQKTFTPHPPFSM